MSKKDILPIRHGFLMRISNGFMLINPSKDYLEE